MRDFPAVSRPGHDRGIALEGPSQAVSAEDRPAALKHLRRLLTGKPDATAVEELRGLASRIESQLEAPSADASPDDETSDPRARKLLALATLFHRYGQSKLTAKYLARIARRASPPGP